MVLGGQFHFLDVTFQVFPAYQFKLSIFNPPSPSLSQWERERKTKDTGCPIEPGMTEIAKAVFRLLREWPKVTKGLFYALAMFCYDLAMFAMFLRCFVAMLL